MGEALLETRLPGLPARRGKVRDVYDLGDGRLLVVATDRISAFDWVLPTGIPDKGRVLTGLSAFWFARIGVPNHLIGLDPDEAGLDLDAATRDQLRGRSMIVRKAEVVPFECVVRGYLAGSGWKEYREQGTVCGQELPPGLLEGSRIDPIFTPATKAEGGHDENVPVARMAEAIGQDLTLDLLIRSVRVYAVAHAFAAAQGLILADTKFEWGRDPATGEVLLVDELLTPDSSRYWPAEGYEPGRSQPSFDKQFVRDWLERSGWDKAGPPPPLPDDVVAQTRARYLQAYETITERPFPWT